MSAARADGCERDRCHSHKGRQQRRQRRMGRDPLGALSRLEEAIRRGMLTSEEFEKHRRELIPALPLSPSLSSSLSSPSSSSLSLSSSSSLSVSSSSSGANEGRGRARKGERKVAAVENVPPPSLPPPLSPPLPPPSAIAHHNTSPAPSQQPAKRSTRMRDLERILAAAARVRDLERILHTRTESSSSPLNYSGVI